MKLFGSSLNFVHRVSDNIISRGRVHGFFLFIWQSDIDEGLINMIVLIRQIINQWLNDQIMDASAATLMILQRNDLPANEWLP